MPKTFRAAILLMLLSTGSAVAQPTGSLMKPHDGPPPVNAAMLEKRADDLSLLIGLTSGQRPLLEAMLRTIIPPARTENSRPEDPDARHSAPPVDGPFAEQLAQMERLSAERAKADQERMATLKAFYNSLNAGQRERFEAVMRLSHGGPAGFGPPPPPPHRPHGPGSPSGL